MAADSTVVVPDEEIQHSDLPEPETQEVKPQPVRITGLMSVGGNQIIDGDQKELIVNLS